MKAKRHAATAPVPPLLNYLLRDEGLGTRDKVHVGRAIPRIAVLLGVPVTDIPYTLTPEWAARIRAVLPQLRAMRSRKLSTLQRMQAQDPVLPLAPDPVAPLVPDPVAPAQPVDLSALRAEIAAEMAGQFDERVQQAADARVAERTARLDRWEQELTDLQLRLRARQASVVELMSLEEFQIVRSVLHPDRAPPDRVEKYARAFQIFARLEATVNWNLPASALRACGWELGAPFRRNGGRVLP